MSRQTSATVIFTQQRKPDAASINRGFLGISFPSYYPTQKFSSTYKSFDPFIKSVSANQRVRLRHDPRRFQPTLLLPFWMTSSLLTSKDLSSPPSITILTQDHYFAV